ncbi:MAG: hypothetical protein AABX11_04490 [Nanoarchaeota archaeon]
MTNIETREDFEAFKELYVSLRLRASRLPLAKIIKLFSSPSYLPGYASCSSEIRANFISVYENVNHLRISQSSMNIFLEKLVFMESELNRISNT